MVNLKELILKYSTFKYDFMPSMIISYPLNLTHERFQIQKTGCVWSEVEKFISTRQN